MKSVIKYPGGKCRLASWITSYFPPHTVYLEPYFGGGSIFFAKAPAKYETLNDLDKRVVNFFKVCRDQPAELATAVNLTPFSRTEYELVQESHSGEEIQLCDDEIENARRFLIRCSQGFGSKLSDRVGWKNTKHSSGPVNATVWAGLPDTIIEAAERLKHAQIECRPADELIEKYNGSDCLIYADPPYLLSERSGRMYSIEMGKPLDHIQMLNLLKAHEGPVVISGYDNPLYNEYLKSWKTAVKETTANSAAVRTEKIWMNF